MGRNFQGAVTFTQLKHVSTLRQLFIVATNFGDVRNCLVGQQFLLSKFTLEQEKWVHPIAGIVSLKFFNVLVQYYTAHLSLHK